MAKHENIVIDKDRGIVRVTTTDERWYAKKIGEEKSGVPIFKYYPSVTWIGHYYYMNPYLLKWIAEKGLDEAELIKKEAGVRGSKVHQGTELLDAGEKLNIGVKLKNTQSGNDEEVTMEEWKGLVSYYNWFQLERPTVFATEKSYFNEEHEYAGTLDRIYALGWVKVGVRQIWIVDFKTSKQVTRGHIIQLSALSHLDIDYKSLGITEEEWANRKLAVLQLGYEGNKQGYKFTQVPDRFKLFLNCKETWAEETSDIQPKQRDFPIEIQLTIEAPK